LPSLHGSGLSASGRFEIKQSAFGMKPISVGGVVSVKDTLDIDFSIVATEDSCCDAPSVREEHCREADSAILAGTIDAYRQLLTVDIGQKWTAMLEPR
jgi:hypothetical protein